MKFKTGDQIIVGSGKDRGKTGKIIKIDKSKNKAIVDGINIYKAHIKPSNKYPQGGVIDKNMPIALSNLNFLCSSCNKSTRVKYSGCKKEKTRICVKCKETINEVK